jgi:electron transfer flavoprotein-quinone oxidoreductase
MVSDLKKNKVKPYELLEAAKRHPSIRKLIQGGETKEYSGHLIPEGGLKSVPPLSGNGWVICGDAAQLINFVHREGTNLAMSSGRMAGEAIIEAHKQGNYSRQALSLYDAKVKQSFIHKDLKKYQGLHGLLAEMDPRLLFESMPRALNRAAFEMINVDGVSKAEKQRLAIKLLKEAAGGTASLLKLGYKGWRAING